MSRKDMEIFEIWFEETMIPAARTDEGQPMYAYNLKRIKEIMRKSWKGAWFLKDSEVLKLREENEKLQAMFEFEKTEKEKIQQTTDKVITILHQGILFYANNNSDLMEQNQYGKKVPLGSNALKVMDKIKRYKEFVDISEEKIVTHEETSEKGLQDILETMLDNSDPEQDISSAIKDKIAQKEMKNISVEEDHELSKKELEFQKKAQEMMSEDTDKIKKKFSIEKF